MTRMSTTDRMGQMTATETPTVVLPFRLPPAAPDECVMCGVGLGQGLTLVARAAPPLATHCISCAQWLDGPYE